MLFDHTDTKTQLFRAGVREFAAKGYKAATVRDICKRADAANASAVNYYFGGKEGLYRAVLDILFTELGRRWDEVDKTAPDDLAEAERLKLYTATYCGGLYAEDDISRDFVKIFLTEMMRPSPMLENALAGNMMPQVERILGLIRNLLGPHASEIEARRCFVSVFGPLLYPAVVEPTAEPFFRGIVHGDLAGFIDHAHRFAMAGIDATRAALEEAKEKA